MYNLEATPAESTSYRLAKHDKAKYPDIITASKNDNVPYYTNSSHLPVGYTEDIFEALDIQDELQTLYTSGTVFHAFLGQKLSDWKSAANLVRKIAENYRLPYFTLSPTYSICCEHGYIDGEIYKCPDCGRTTEVYSRITGYYRPVQNWNDGKTEEFKERKEYVIENSRMKDKTVEVCECETKEASAEAGIMLFTSPTCPNCKMAKSILDKAGIAYTQVDAMSNKELTGKFGIKKAPTLIVSDGTTVVKYENASEIKRFVESK